MPLVNGLHCATPRFLLAVACVPKSALSRDRPFPSLRFSVFLSMIVFHLIKFFSPLSFLFVLLVLD